jgi:hypothetical protein
MKMACTTQPMVDLELTGQSNSKTCAVDLDHDLFPNEGTRGRDGN